MAKKYGQWEIVRSLDEGGQGQVFLVNDSTGKLAGEYALKRLKNKDRIARFKQEAEAGMRLEHPNIVRFVSADMESDSPFLVTTFYPKGNLSDFDLAQLKLLERLKIFRSICCGVAHAHSNAICHRDIKPDNVFLAEDGTPAVGDFGICFISEDGARHTLTEEAVGPRLFMAPELEDGRAKEIKPAVDVYSLGKLLYWMLAEKTCFAREKHREPAYDLTKRFQDSAYALIYDLFDSTIVESKVRLLDASALLKKLDDIIVQIQSGGHVLDFSARQQCTYCVLGTYQIVINGSQPSAPQSVRDFGVMPYTDSEWSIFVCDRCGNVQLFRHDYVVDNKTEQRVDNWKNRRKPRQ